MSTALLDPETLAERAAIIVVEHDLPDEEGAALALFWAGWVPPELRRPVPSALTYHGWPLRPVWAQTVLQLTPYRSPVVLRPYQQEAADAAYAAWQRGESVVLDLATGGGKSLVIAELCRRIEGRVLVITHRQELLEQNSAELQLLLGPSVDYGIYCAGLGRKESAARVVFASIASAYRAQDALISAGPWAAIIVDEAHRLPFRVDPDGSPSTSMYAQYFARLGEPPPLIGLTATPSRMGVAIWGHPAAWFDSVASRAGMADLTPAYLLPLAPIQGIVTIDTSTVHTVGGEYNTKELSRAASEERVVRAAVAEVCTYAPEVGCQSWLVFCVDQAHCAIVLEAFRAQGVAAAMVTEKTPRKERAQIFAAMKAGELTCLVNCEIATTGSNIPRLDCLVILRPTKSKELYIQMLGRGTRQFQDLQRCVVMDYTDNHERHSPLEGVPALEPRHTAPCGAGEDDKAAAAEREERERAAKHLATLAGQEPPHARRYHVEHVRYQIGRSKDNTKDMLIVDYRCRRGDLQKRIRIWVCPQHRGKALAAARTWLQRHGNDVERALQMPVPELADRLTRYGRMPQAIVVDETEAFPRILMEYF